VKKWVVKGKIRGGENSPLYMTQRIRGFLARCTVHFT